MSSPHFLGEETEPREVMHQVSLHPPLPPLGPQKEHSPANTLI